MPVKKKTARGTIPRFVEKKKVVKSGNEDMKKIPNSDLEEFGSDPE